MLLVLPVLVLLAIGPESPSINHCDSLIAAQARSAIALVREAERPVPSSSANACSLAYAGTVVREDHLMRPGMTRTVPFRLEVAFDAAADAMMVQEVSGSDRPRRVETTVLLRGRVAHQGSAEQAFTELAAEQRPGEAASIFRWLPWTAAHAAVSAASSCRPGGVVEFQGSKLTPVSFPDPAVGACTLLLNESRRVVRIESLTAHARLGDVCDWTRFEDWKDHGGTAVPERIVRFVALGGSTMKFDLSLASFSPGPIASAVFDLPPERRGGIVDWRVAPIPTASAGVEFVRLAGGLWALEIQACDSRVLVIERDADLVLLEAPDGDAVCGQIITALRERFPGKPVAIAAFGHHHPASSGGLRSLSSAGATIVAPAVLGPYVDWLLSRQTSFGGPAVAAPERPSIELFTGERTIEAGDATVRLIDIGEHSAHAFSYVVFYFPKIGVLFEGDLGYFPVDGAVRAGPRMKGLTQELDRLNVEPRRLVQAWPVRGARREIDWPSVVKAIGASAQPPVPK